MSKLFRAAAIGVAVSVTGCAIHPLPDNVTGVSTFQIVQKIRCEARDALKEDLIAWLTSPKMQEHDAAAYWLGQALQDGSQPLESFYSRGINNLSPLMKANIQTFQKTAIAYDFSFDMTETDNLDPSVDLTRPLRNQSFSATVGANFDRMRENKRTFTITDTFEVLFTKINDKYCSNIATGGNYIYPITGKIGVAEMIKTFVELTLFGDLNSVQTTVAEDAQAASPPPTMGDTLTFTTTLTLTPVPMITLTPIGTALQISSATLMAKASRNDAHQVIVALALPPPSGSSHGTSSTCNTMNPASQSGVRVMSSTQPRPLLINTKACASPAEKTATHTIEQIITRFEVGRAVVVQNQ
jgi:hypothetical protein